MSKKNKRIGFDVVQLLKEEVKVIVHYSSLTIAKRKVTELRKVDPKGDYFLYHDDGIIDEATDKPL